MPNNPIGIRELIERVKAELTAPHSGDKPIFALSRVELTISFTVERNHEGSIDLHVIKTGVAKTTTEVQTVVVTLDPLITPEKLGEGMTPNQVETAKKVLYRELFPSDGA